MKGIAALFSAGTTPNAPTSPPPPPPPSGGEPDAPTSLALSSRTATTATFTFTDNSSDEDGFRLKVDGSTNVSGSSSPLTATGLTEGTEYDFTVVAYNASGESSASNTVTTYTQLATPTSLSGFTITDFVRFTWTDNSASEGEYVLVKDSTDYVTLPADTTTTDVDSSDAASGTWTVEARDSVIPNSDASSGVSAPWPE